MLVIVAHLGAHGCGVIGGSNRDLPHPGFNIFTVWKMLCVGITLSKIKRIYTTAAHFKNVEAKGDITHYEQYLIMSVSSRMSSAAYASK